VVFSPFFLLLLLQPLSGADKGITVFSDSGINEYSWITSFTETAGKVQPGARYTVSMGFSSLTDILEPFPISPNAFLFNRISGSGFISGWTAPGQSRILRWR
jgi:hypothetical protein